LKKNVVRRKRNDCELRKRKRRKSKSNVKKLKGKNEKGLT